MLSSVKNARLPFSLTPQEARVVDLVVVGHSNKEAARVLGISSRTIEVHRARAMEKVDATNLASLVLKIAANAGSFPSVFPRVARTTRVSESNTMDYYPPLDADADSG